MNSPDRRNETIAGLRASDPGAQLLSCRYIPGMGINADISIFTADFLVMVNMGFSKLILE